MKERNIYIIAPILVFIISGLVLCLAILYSWLGEAREGIMLFCENARTGFIKQPSNSFSNLGFGLAGLYTAWLVFNNEEIRKSYFAQNKIYALSMSIIMILLGAGSFAMHATNTFWGGFCDLFAMFLTSSYFACYALRRLLKINDVKVIGLYSISVILSSYVFLSSWNHFGFILSAAEIIVAFQIIAASIIELYMSKMNRTKIDISWAIFGVVTLFIAFGIWNISRTHDSIWCNPDSLIQGHALWHILNAISLVAIFRFYASEQIIKPAANNG